MRVTLVGADCEENLGLGMIAASLLRAGHAVRVVAFDEARQGATVAAEVLGTGPDLVGLGLQFQYRAPDFLDLAAELRRRGYRGHITAGGQHASLAYEPILRGEPAIDSIVRFEGETTIVELAAALERQGSLESVAGLALHGPGGAACTPPRRLAWPLDELPAAHRYRPHTVHAGLPFIPMTGSRGCWGACAFCSITSYYRAARQQARGGKLLRLRSPENLAQEMAALHGAAGADASLFCFHDDSFLLPRPTDTLTRLRTLGSELRARGVQRYGLIGKCRPNSITPQYARQLRALGVVRLFVGIENASQPGQDHLDRRTRSVDLERALTSLRDAGIFATYNLLLFEPDATLEDVRENAAFLQRFAGTPGNFCRAEAFHGTPLYERLAARGSLLGDYRGWDYRIADDRVELLFRLTLAAFRERNYDSNGVGNRHVGLGYLAQIVRVFVDEDSPEAQQALARASATVAGISLDSAAHLERAIRVVQHLDPGNHREAERAAVDLAQRVTTQDRYWQRELDHATDALQRVIDRARFAPRLARTGRRPQLTQRAALAGTLLAAAACGGSVGDEGRPSGDGGAAEGVTGGSGATGGETGGSGGTGGLRFEGDGGFPPTVGGTGGTIVTGGATSTGGVQGDGGFPPTIGGTGGLIVTGGSSGTGGLRFEGDGGFPPTVGGTGGLVVTGGSSGAGGWAGDSGGVPPVGGGLAGQSDLAPPPIVGGRGGAGGVGESAGSENDLPGPGGAGGVSGAGDAGSSVEGGAAGSGALASAQASLVCDEPVDHWRDTTPGRPMRDAALPLFDPPRIALEGFLENGTIRVVVRGATPEMDLDWAGPGVRKHAGGELHWSPNSPRDRLTVVARHGGGVASASLLAGDASTG
jgi:radical SAM superfamily enzyme YgiQ (UPF0313 family)